ncbi:tumor suppressor candidate 2-like [Daktulosphaira vitifoliae]|uniref:tumor suppressor candidate 2-like n=1 Tax=Daktulosphaira vitifoliae TaxID=58002 RepID=UPI0021AAD2BF|nr:tumor suppressor candidate 2-like [Daktulosphaira vitifoliae]
MGGKTSKPSRGSSNQLGGKKYQNEEQINNDTNQHQQYQKDFISKSSLYPFVHHRRGSMYIDEDGDVAHEFYEEAKEGSKLTLKKIGRHELIPQGDVPLDVPCIKYDYPVVLLEQPICKKKQEN